MIKINKSETADTRTCDFTKVTKDTLEASSVSHIRDVYMGLRYFQELLEERAKLHDWDKLSNLDGFHSDFIGGFKSTIWWDEHRKINRHHLLQPDGVPVDVNLIDVLEMIVDCVMAGMARSGSVYPLDVTPELLKRACDNTVNLLMSQVEVNK
jgi:hypothetical protein